MDVKIVTKGNKHFYKSKTTQGFVDKINEAIREDLVLEVGTTDHEDKGIVFVRGRAIDYYVILEV